MCSIHLNDKLQKFKCVYFKCNNPTNLKIIIKHKIFKKLMQINIRDPPILPHLNFTLSPM